MSGGYLKMSGGYLIISGGYLMKMSLFFALIMLRIFNVLVYVCFV